MSGDWISRAFALERAVVDLLDLDVPGEQVEGLVAETIDLHVNGTDGRDCPVHNQGPRE